MLYGHLHVLVTLRVPDEGYSRNASWALNLISTFLFIGCCVVRSFVILLCSFCLSGLRIFCTVSSIFDQIPVHKILGVMEWWYPWEILKGDWPYTRY